MIYFLEDDNNIRNFVIYALNNTGLEAEGFETPEKFWEAMKNEMPDLLLLDIMLPGEDGISILKKIRNNGRTRKLPVIMQRAPSMTRCWGLTAVQMIMSQSRSAPWS